MTNEQAKTLIYRLEQQVENGFKRILQLENEGEFGLAHTMMREQINGTLQTVDWLRETLPHPFLPIYFHQFSLMVMKYKPRCSWLGWI